jgi:hypothetical protein
MTEPLRDKEDWGVKVDESAFTWEEMMIHRGYPAEWVQQAKERRDAKLLQDLS